MIPIRIPFVSKIYIYLYIFVKICGSVISTRLLKSIVTKSIIVIAIALVNLKRDFIKKAMQYSVSRKLNVGDIIELESLGQSQQHSLIHKLSIRTRYSYTRHS